MSKPEILIRLRGLHQELSAINDDLTSADQVDEETVDALGQLITDVGTLVDHAREVTSEAVEAPKESHEMLDRVMKFETDHPKVTSFLSQVTDLLAMIGI